MALIRTFTPRYPSSMERFLDEDLRDLFRSNFSSTETTVPAVNVKETDDEFRIEVAAPGMKKDDFKVNLEDNLLTVSSEHKEETKEEEEKYARREFSYQSFQRTFTVPENMVDGTQIDAKYHDGILQIKLPKLEHAKTKPASSIIPSALDKRPSKLRIQGRNTARTGIKRIFPGTFSNSIGANRAVIPNASAMATMADPIMEPRAMPYISSKDPTAPTARFSGSNPIKITLIKNADIPNPSEVPTTPLTSFSAKKMTSASPATNNITEAAMLIVQVTLISRATGDKKINAVIRRPGGFMIFVLIASSMAKRIPKFCIRIIFFNLYNNKPLKNNHLVMRIKTSFPF